MNPATLVGGGSVDPVNDAVVVGEVVAVGPTLEVVVSGTTDVVVDAGAVAVGTYQAADESPAVSGPK